MLNEQIREREGGALGRHSRAPAGWPPRLGFFIRSGGGGEGEE